MSPRRRRHVIAPLQAAAIEARRGGFWRVRDRCFSAVMPMYVGRIEGFRFIITPLTKESPPSVPSRRA